MMARKLPTIGHTRRGFTLIEIMLALLVITVGIVAVSGLLGTALDSSAKAHSDLDVVSFSDLVFNHCHALEDWDEIPTAGSLVLTDYAENPQPLALGTIAQFTSNAPGKNGIPAERYTVTYQLDIALSAQHPAVKELSLQIWPGFSANGEPRRFQTEIYDWTKN
jgi:prepilin-type N-terminal cleavage/methylation domain-containing protein